MGDVYADGVNGKDTNLGYEYSPVRSFKNGTMWLHYDGDCLYIRNDFIHEGFTSLIDGKRAMYFSPAANRCMIYNWDTNSSLVNFSEGNATIYVATEDDTVTVVDLANRSIVNIIDIGFLPNGVCMSPDERYVYVATYRGNRIYVIDRQINGITATLHNHDSPQHNYESIAITPDGRHLLFKDSVQTCGFGCYHLHENGSPSNLYQFGSDSVGGIAVCPLNDTVWVCAGSWVYVFASMEETDVTHSARLIAQTQICTNSMVDSTMDIVFNHSGTRAYVTVYEHQYVYVVDTSTHNVIMQTPALNNGSGHATGLVMSPDGTKLYVALSGTEYVSVVNVATGQEIRTYEVGSNPVDVDVTGDGRYVVAMTRGENSIAVIDTELESVFHIEGVQAPRSFGHFVVSSY